jgi:hypothetical protein
LVKYISSISLNLEVVVCFRTEAIRNKLNSPKKQAVLILFGKINNPQKKKKKKKKRRKPGDCQPWLNGKAVP